MSEAGATRSTFAQRLGLAAAGVLAALLLFEVGLQAASLVLRAGREPAGAAPPDAKADEYRILCLGESTTARYGQPLSYPRLLQQELREGDFDMAFRVFNAGTLGANTNQLVEKLPELLRGQRPHMVIAMMGVNDALYFSEVENAALPRPIERLMLHSRLYKLLRLAWADLERRWRGTPPAFLEAEDPEHWAAYQRLILEVAAAPDPASAEQTLLSMIRIAREVRLPDGGERASVTGIHPAYLNGYYRAIAELAHLYRTTGRGPEAIALYEEAIERQPRSAYLYRRFSGLAAELGDERRAEQYRRRSQELASGKPLAVTKASYATLQRILRDAGVTLVAMQYPMRSIEPLKDLLDDAQDVIYADNEAVFRNALAKSDFDALFIDRCCGDFGHATTAGNRLIARNLVEVVFAPRFARAAR